MILIGDKLVSSEKIFFIKNKEEIQNTKANSTVLFSYNEELMQYCSKNNLEMAVEIKSIKEAIYVNAFEAKYIIVTKDIASKIQKLAENYMFDSKILTIINSNDELEEIATLEIDGVIYQNLFPMGK